MDIQAALNHIIEGHDLERSAMQSVMQQIMTGECEDAQIAGLLVALRIKGETVDEITGAAEVMASLASHVAIEKAHLIDIVGTGGDGLSTFNVSTASSFVAAGAGCTVAKHGNRSVSSKSGSADLLEAAGANLSLEAEQVAQVIEQAGVGFMFAPMHHSAMKHAIGARKALGIRTIFNVLGPLTNPAHVKRQVIGVFDRSLCTTMAEVFKHLGSEHTLVVHSEDGLDEISISAPTHVSEMIEGDIKEYSIAPENFGLTTVSMDKIVVSNPAESLDLVNAVLKGDRGPARDIVVLNAGAGIYVSGLAESLEAGVTMAQESIDQGKALNARDQYVAATQSV